MQDHFKLAELNVWRKLESASHEVQPSDRDKGYEPLQMSQSESAGIAAFIDLLGRPWFHRAWTYQECRLASETLIVTGSYQIQGSLISQIELGMKAALYNETGFRVLGKAFLMRIVDLYYMFNPDFVPRLVRHHLDFWETLSFLLVLRRGAAARDPRDIVCSLIGVASLTNPLEIELDYGTSWESFYTGLTKQIICKTRDLDQLAAVDQNSESSCTCRPGSQIGGSHVLPDLAQEIVICLANIVLQDRR
jgi:hypothetical protein